MRSVAEEKWNSYNPADTVTRRRSKLSTFLASRGYEGAEIQAMVQTFGVADSPAE